MADGDESDAASCDSDELTTEYWTSFPGMMNIISGFDVIDSGTAACVLPEYPRAISLVPGPNESPQPSVNLPTPIGTTSNSDFVPYSSATDWLAPALVDYDANPGALELQRGGEAVELLYGEVPIDPVSSRDTECIAGPSGGGLEVSLYPTSNGGVGGDPSLFVSVPEVPQLVSQLDPDGSAFDSCVAVVMSPFLTWAEAAALVGAPTPTSSAGPLPLADQEIYQYARRRGTGSAHEISFAVTPLLLPGGERPPLVRANE